MLDNMNYNLIENVSIISKSLYRYETYIKDAAQCKSCQELWSKFEEQRKKELSLILKELKAHVKKLEQELNDARVNQLLPKKVEEPKLQEEVAKPVQQKIVRPEKKFTSPEEKASNPIDRNGVAPADVAIEKFFYYGE